MQLRPSREDFRALARSYTVVPVWAELLADLETPVAAYVKLVGDEPGFLLESVEHGERWSRFSFVGRDPVATLVLRDGRVDVDGPLPVAVPTDRGDPGGDGGDAGDVPRAGDRRAAAAARRADGIPRLRRRAGGRATAEPAARRSSSAGRRAVDDRLARRLRSLAPARHADRERARARPRLGRARRRIRRCRGQHRAGSRQVGEAAAVPARRASVAERRAAGGQELDARRALPAGRRGGQGAHRRRRHLPGRAWPSGTTSSSMPSRSTCTECCAR